MDTEGALTDVELRVARDQLDRAYAEQDKLKQQLAELHSRPKQVPSSCPCAMSDP